MTPPSPPLLPPCSPQQLTIIHPNIPEPLTPIHSLSHGPPPRASNPSTTPDHTPPKPQTQIHSQLFPPCIQPMETHQHRAPMHHTGPHAPPDNTRYLPTWPPPPSHLPLPIPTIRKPQHKSHPRRPPPTHLPTLHPPQENQPLPPKLHTTIPTRRQNPSTHNNSTQLPPITLMSQPNHPDHHPLSAMPLPGYPYPSPLPCNTQDLPTSQVPPSLHYPLPRPIHGSALPLTPSHESTTKTASTNYPPPNTVRPHTPLLETNYLRIPQPD